jgi:hypothetical protein|tara:strand:+ start:421 stop:576 length:156 start_codon:yes stop_codon:yes gene_type:complete
MSTKGHWQRPTKDKSKFNEQYDRIFSKPKDDKPTNEYNEQEDLGDVNDTTD